VGCCTTFDRRRADPWHGHLRGGGSVLVSYVKARAEAQSFSAREGLLTRAERYLVLGPALLFNAPAVGVWIVAILANITALQRILVVRSQAHASAKRLIPEESK
jgi:CDP-diacylglycerol--glycerol-3-phosphate 3-phosphatidyltransferase